MSDFEVYIKGLTTKQAFAKLASRLENDRRRIEELEAPIVEVPTGGDRVALESGEPTSFERVIEKDKDQALFDSLARRVSALENKPDDVEPLPENAFFAKLTDETAGVYTFVEVFLNSSGEWATVTDGESGTIARELNDGTGVNDDTIVIMRGEIDSGGSIQYRFWGAGAAAGGTVANPKVLYSTFEPAEAAATQNDSWDRSSQGANDGVKLYVDTGITYKHAGDEKLYGFYRELVFDSVGRLVTISTGTRYEIDVPEVC